MPVAGSSKRDACKSEACAIQDCLAKNDYDMSKCQDKVDKLKKCCKDSMMESVHCGMVDSRTDTDSGESQKPDDQVALFCIAACKQKLFAATMAMLHSVPSCLILLLTHAMQSFGNHRALRIAHHNSFTGSNIFQFQMLLLCRSSEGILAHHQVAAKSRHKLQLSNRSAAVAKPAAT